MEVYGEELWTCCLIVVSGTSSKFAYIDQIDWWNFTKSTKDNVHCRALTSQGEMRSYLYTCKLKCRPRSFRFSHLIQVTQETGPCLILFLSGCSSFPTLYSTHLHFWLPTSWHFATHFFLLLISASQDSSILQVEDFKQLHNIKSLVG